MENKKEKVALNDELLDKVAGGGVTRDELLANECHYCSCIGCIEYIGRHLYQCMVCKRIFNY